MINYYETIHRKRTEIINYALLALYLSISITCHAIANRLVIIGSYPIFASGLVYMTVFVLTDVLASFNSRKLVIYFIFLEALSNLFFMGYTHYINTLPFPDFFEHAAAYETVFNPVAVLYFSNLVGNVVSSLIDLYIFFYLYRKIKLGFLLASIISSSFTIFLYTIVTDVLAFRESFPDQYIRLTTINIFSNLVTVIIFAFIGQFVVSRIQKYINDHL